MKKKYIRPESRLFAINLAENIADGSIPGEGTGGHYTTGLGIGYYLFPNGIEGYIAGEQMYHFHVDSFYGVENSVLYAYTDYLFNKQFNGIMSCANWQ